MKKLKMITSIVITLIIITAVALRMAVPHLTGESVASGIIDNAGASMLGDCPDTPNCVCSEASRTDQTIERFAITQSADTAISTLAAIVAEQPQAAIVEQTDVYLHTTFTTKIMGYVDDIEFLLSDDKQSVQVRSASRIGKSDLGANAKRIAALRELASESM